MPNMSIMPAKGGSAVIVLKMGTANKQNKPMIKMLFLIGMSRDDGREDVFSDGICSPFKEREVKIKGINRDIKLGKKMDFIIFPLDMLSLTQSMIVVTSPIGVQAPPALAAIMTMLQNSHLSLGNVINF